MGGSFKVSVSWLGETTSEEETLRMSIRLIALAAALSVAPTLALAAETTTKIRYIDEEGRRMLLGTNDFIKVGDQVDLEQFGVGQTVVITYDGELGQAEATVTAMVPAPVPEPPPGTGPVLTAEQAPAGQAAPAPAATPQR